MVIYFLRHASAGESVSNPKKDEKRALDETGLVQNTLFIFTSDNGADWKLEDLARFAHRANGDWRGEKADIWEAGHRIPFVARWPGAIRPNSTSKELGSLADLMATVAAITGLPLPAHSAEDSFNLLPALLGKNTSPIRDSVILHSIDGMFSIRQGNWKLEEGLGSGGFSPPRKVEPAPGGPTGQLYDLSADPGELHNLYQARPEIVDRLATLLDRYKRQGYTRSH
jgi:arylsulfatase A-like enzyme